MGKNLSLRDWIPGSVGLDLPIVVRGDLAVYISGVQATPMGVDLRLSLVLHLGTEASGRSDLFDLFEVDRPFFGGEFSDGSTFLWLRKRLEIVRELLEEKAQGREGERRRVVRPSEAALQLLRMTIWEQGCDAHLQLSPLPTPGPLRLVFAWPERAIPETMVTLDAAPVLAAAAKATRLWRDGSSAPRRYVHSEERRPRAPVRPEGHWFVDHYGDIFT